MLNLKQKNRNRARRIRKRLVSCSNKSSIRLIFNKSNKYIYIQAVCSKGKTLFALGTLAKIFADLDSKRNILAATAIGAEMAKLMNKKYPHSTFFFDRGSSRYQGKVKACVESARRNGLKI